jgi:predicted MFS family arabinose efflux permease
MHRMTTPGSRFTAASAVSFTGDWLTTVAVATVLYRAMGNPGPACYMLARVLPRPLGALTGGAIAQRTGPRRTALTTIALQVFLSALLLAAVLARNPFGILGVVVLQQWAGSALVPAAQALIPSVVAPGERAGVLARNALAVGVSVVAGPPLGGLLLALTSPALTVLVDGATFVVAFVLLATLPVSHQTSEPVQQTQNRPRAWRRVRQDPLLAAIAAGMLGCYATVTALQAGMVPAAVERIGSAAGVGLLYSAVGAGAVAGGIYARRRAGAARWIAGAMAAETIAAILFTQTLSVIAGLLALAAVAAAGSVIQVGCGLAVMNRVERDALPGVNGVLFACGYTGMGLGAFAALVGSGGGWQLPVQVLAVATLATLALRRLVSLGSERRYGAATANPVLVANRSV